ncbi:MAG TPA: hypothetical protein VGR08_03955, partial [Thermomicrobiales bacterium]|nr:hypothetical protein [Thermomicrobiales bacterium]
MASVARSGKSQPQETDIIASSSPDRDPSEHHHAPSIYQARAESFRQQRDAVHRRWNLLANLRLVGFIALAGVAWLVWRGGGSLLIALEALIAVGVVVLVARHRQLRRERDELQRLIDVNARSRDRALLAWDAAPVPPAFGTDRTHAYAYDLNIVGPASIAQRVGSPTTRHGWNQLHAWLLGSGTPADVTGRQHAVRELARRLDLRQQVEATGGRLDGEIPDPAPFLAWAEGPALLRDRAWLQVVSIAGPLALVLLLLLQALGYVAYPMWLAPLTLNVIVFQIVGGQISDDVAAVAPLHHAIGGYRDMFGLIAADDAASANLRRIKETLGAGPAGAMTLISRLTRISSLAIPR